MEKGKRKLFTTVLSMLLAFMLVADGMFIPNGFKTITKAKAAESLSGMQLGVPVMSEDGNTFSFANAEIAGDKTYTLMSIAVDKGYIVENKTYPWSMTDLGAHKTATWQWDTPKTTAEVQTIIRSISFQHVQGVKVDITIDSSVSELPSGGIITSYKMYNDDMTQYKTHYYMYVPNSGSGGYHKWEEAYHLAKTYTYLGMKGYLVTITEEGEDRVLDNITGNGVQSWAGGVRVRYDADTEKIVAHDSLDSEYFNEASQRPEAYSGGSIASSAWVWACGPEAGMFIPNTSASGYESTDSKTGVNSLVKTHPMMGTYSNWKSGEPNNYSPAEWCLLVHFGSPAQVTNDGWNDYAHDTSSIVGFFVEFGGYEDDPWMDAETGLPVGDETGATSQSTSIQLNEEWTLESNKNVFTAHCDIVMTSLVDGSRTIYPTDVTRTLTFNAADRYYSGSPYSFTNFISATERAEFLTKTGFSESDFPASVSAQFYMDEACTVPTDNSNSGAAGSGKAPVNIGKYYAAATIKGVRVVDDFEIMETPFAENDPDNTFNPAGEDPSGEDPAQPLPLLANLSGYQRKTDGAVVITGYWGETNPEKRLIVSVGGSYAVPVGMADVIGKNFTVTIPGDVVGEATFVDAYHEDKSSEKIRIYTNVHPSCEIVTDTVAVITWPSVPGATGYKIDVSFDASFKNIVSGYAGKAVSGTRINVTGLNPETAYYFRIRVVDSQGKESASSPTICVTTLETGAEPQENPETEIYGAREPYTIGPDGILPRGLLYGQIDYDTDFINDVIIYATDSNGQKLQNTYINLTTEEFVTDLDYTYYSINNGRSWTKATKKIDYKKLQSLLKKGFTLKLMKGTMVKSKPSEDSVVYSFEKINKRQKLSALKINYAIYSDYSGLTNGQWTVMVNGIEVNVAKYWFGIADSTGKQISEKGWGLWPYMDGVWIKDVVADKQLKEKYLYKLPAFGNTPASVTKKVTVYGLAKASKTKVNYTYENMSLNKDYLVYYGEEIPDTRADKEKLIRKTDEAPFEYIDASVVTTAKDRSVTDYLGKVFDNNSDKPVKLLLTAYITDERNTIIVWKKATTTKPASAHQVIRLAARGPVADENTSFTVKNGALKFKIDKTLSYTYYEASTNNWKSVPPKITTNTILTIRAKNTAKGGKENDTQHATGYESYLVLEYGVANAKTGKKGVVSARAFTTMEAAESHLAELNAAGNTQ